MPNGKHLDFRLEKVADGKAVYVEVMNIFLEKSKVTDDDQEITKFLTYRIKQKFLEKKLGLKEDIHFFIVPVLWGDWTDLKIYSDYFKRNKLDIRYISEPIAHVRYTNNINYFDHRFGNVSRIFDLPTSPLPIVNAQD